MLTKKKCVAASAFFALSIITAYAREDSTFSLPDSVLLFGQYSEGLELVTRKRSEMLRIPPGATRNRPVSLASLGTSGRVASWGFPIQDDASKRWKVRCSVAVWSVSARAWRTYGDFSQIHATALSPDDSRVAFIAEKAGTESRALLVLDVRSGEITNLAKLAAVTVSWSHDGNSLVIGTPGGEAAPEIKIFDLASRAIRKLTDGICPSWSPSGEWIAYIDASREKVHLVHPDGTGDRVVKNVGGRLFGYRYFGLLPVWSPDSTRMLLNEFKGDGDSQDVVLLDIKTSEMITKSHNGDPVLGWASDRADGPEQSPQKER